jgi:cytochrome c oxidase subunit 4
MLRTTSTAAKVVRAAAVARPAIRAASTSAHAISKPTLANIEKRWEGMPLQEQADLWMALRDRMKENWAELTLHEKKAGEFYFAFLNHIIYGQLELPAARPCQFLAVPGFNRLFN